MPASLPKNSGHLLYLISQNKPQQSIDLYNQQLQATGEHNYELLHQIGLALLKAGFQQKDPEIQLMTLFGASISAHDDAFYILEEMLQSPVPQLQLVALSTLSKAQNDRADKAMIRAMAAGHPLIRLEAAYQLCLKKHPQAVSQTESLMYKMPSEILPLFPQLFAAVGDAHATRILKRMMNDPSEEVRIATVAAVTKQGRDDFLPQIRKLSSQQSYAQQEICAKALGIFQDENSKAKLQKMAQSQFPYVRMAAWEALEETGDNDALLKIKAAAEQEDLFAIQLLANREGSEELLHNLMNHPKLQVRINAGIVLLHRQDPRSTKGLAEILIRDKRDLGFSTISTPGGSMTAYKATPSAGELLKDEAESYAENIQIKEEILTLALDLPEESFLQVAEGILSAGQNELIPKVIQLLGELQTEKAVDLLKKYYQKPGAPLIRHYCNLALYQLKEEGPYAQCLRDWVKSQNKIGLIQFRPLALWDKRDIDAPYILTPEETSRLLVDSMQAFASLHDKEGIEILLDAIRDGNAKNRYALAGLLVRATQ